MPSTQTFLLVQNHGIDADVREAHDEIRLNNNQIQEVRSTPSLILHADTAGTRHP